MAMNYKTMLKLFQEVVNGLISREDQQVDDIISHNELSSDLRIIFQDYVNLVRQNVKANDAHIRDYIFLKDVIDKIGKKIRVSIQDVMTENDINIDKRQLVVQLIKRIQQMEQEQRTLDEQNSHLHKMLNNYQGEAQQERQNLRKQIAVLNRKNQEQSDLILKLQVELESYQHSSIQTRQKTRKISQLQRKVQLLQLQNQQKAKQIQSTNLNVEEVAGEILQVQRKLSDKEQYLKGTIQQNQQLQYRLKQKDKFIQQILAQVKQLEAQIARKQQFLRTTKIQLQQQKLTSQNFSKIIDQKQQLIKNKDQNIFELKQSVQGQRQKYNTVSRLNVCKFIFSNEDDIFLYLKKLFISNQALVESFLSKISTQVGDIKKVQLLYKYSLHKHMKFHDLIDKKPGILLLCLTSEDRLIGGFTTAAFSIEPQSPNTKAFLFSSQQDSIRTYNLKSGKPSLQYDGDYIIFGHEQLCIQKNSLELSSSLVNGMKRQLHYQIHNDQRETFLQSKNSNGRKLNTVALKDYQVLQIQF